MHKRNFNYFFNFFIKNCINTILKLFLYQMVKFFKLIDYYPLRVSLRYKGEEDYRTNTGGVLTVFSFLAICLSRWKRCSAIKNLIRGLKLVNKEGPCYLD